MMTYTLYLVRQWQNQISPPIAHTKPTPTTTTDHPPSPRNQQSLSHNSSTNSPTTTSFPSPPPNQLHSPIPTRTITIRSMKGILKPHKIFTLLVCQPDQPISLMHAPHTKHMLDVRRILHYVQGTI